MGGGYDMWQLYAPQEDASASGLDPATRQRMTLQAAALRRQGDLGTLGALTGDKVLAPYGQHLLAAAQQGGQELAAVPEKRALQRLRELQGRKEAVDTAAAEAEQARTTAPGTVASKTARQLLAKFMPKVQVDPNATAADLMPALSLAEKAYQVDENSRNRALQRFAMKQQQDALLGNLGEDTLNALAEKFAAGGGLPRIGLGKAAAGVNMAVMQRAAERHPNLDLAAAEANYKADANSRKKLQEQADRVDAFERTAIANLDTAIGAAKKVVDVGSPWFNKPLRAVQQGLAGSPDMQRYITARQVAVQEVAKVLSGAMGNAAVSDSARHEVEALLGPDASLEQITAAAEVLKQDMANRKVAMRAQLQEIGGRYSSSGHGAQETATPTPPAAAPSSADQKALAWLRANPNDPRAADIAAALKAKGLSP